MLLERGAFLEILAGPPGRLVLVGGEAGVGKTTLLREFAAASLLRESGTLLRRVSSILLKLEVPTRARAIAKISTRSPAG